MNPTHQNLAHRCAKLAFQGFQKYNQTFNVITRRARERFEKREWAGSLQDQVERIELYEKSINENVSELRLAAGKDAENETFWQQIKLSFEESLKDQSDQEFPKTYFNSLTRKFFNTIGVNPTLEFISSPGLEASSHGIPLKRYETKNLRVTAREILMDYSFRTPYRDAAGSVDVLAAELISAFDRQQLDSAKTHIELIETVFFQSKRAYLVGQTVTASGSSPVVIALKNTDGVAVDAVLQSRNVVSILFGFSRSYMHVNLNTVVDVVSFLQNLLPQKPVSELFTVLGRAKQGKTERYRDLFRHLDHSSDPFVHAAGTKGMVMIVFTMESYDVVFKVIRDEFAQPKSMSRKDVMAKYQLVFNHDRAGRLVDAQEFRMLEFETRRFSRELLDELSREAKLSVEIRGDKLILKHCYIERRLTPLNIYVREECQEDIHEAVIDYGQALRDLARTNIFPGDLLLKNFGVTRNKRVIFYDYDELCLLNECNFRDMPKPRTLEEELQSDAWFFVDEKDVFPEQFVQFLGLSGDLLKTFLKHHQDLLTARYWRRVQSRLAAGEILEVLPYYRSRPLRP